MIDFGLAGERAVLFENFDDDGVGVPNGFAEQFFGQLAGCAFGLKHAAGGIDGAIDRDAVTLADDEIFLAVARRSVDSAGALFESDVIAIEAEGIAIEKRMTENNAIKFGAREAREDFLFPTESFGDLREQAFGDDGGAFRRIDNDVLILRMEGDGEVGGDGPGRGGPDERRRRCGRRARDRERRIARQLEAHVDGWAGVIFVFDFGFGERGAVFDAPVNGLETFIDITGVEKIDEGLRDDGLVFGRHGEIWIFPAAEDAEALEFGAVDVDELRGIGAALGADLGDGHGGFALAEFLIDFEFDGQAVAIPAGDVGGVEAGHGFRFDDEIFEDLIEGGAEVNVAVGVGRAVVQDILLAAGAGFTNGVIELVFFPFGEHFGLGGGKVRLHRKIGFGEVDRLFEVNS